MSHDNNQQYDNTNRGVLFKNDKGDNPARPDYSGNINVNGEEFRLAAWLKDSASGNKFMSLSVSKPDPNYQKAAPAQQTSPADTIYDVGDEPIDLDSIPF